MVKVSVIIPIYNVKAYMKKSVESAMKQSESNIEIILVDDGSTDGSAALCDEYAQQDQRIIVVHKENGGLSSARNAGAMRASGEYVLFLDGDDYLKENAVERLLDVAQAYPSDFIQFCYQEVNYGETPKEQEHTGKIYQAHTSRELFDNLYKLGGVAASGATKMMRRELALNIPFISIRHEDEMWCTQAFQQNLTVTYIPDELYYYVMRDNSIIHSHFHRGKMEIFTVIDARLKVLKQLGFCDLVAKEYNKLFLTLLSLNNEAVMAGDDEAQRMIRSIFYERKAEIAANGTLQGKFKIIFHMMTLYYPSIRLYYFYWRRKLCSDRVVRNGDSD